MSESQADNLRAYTQLPTEAVEIDVNEYAYLVKRIAHHMMVRMPASVQVEDLIQSGMVGLIEAARKYDAGKGASFETYAGIRIRGSIVDEMRRGDWAPRSVHKNGREIASAISEIEHREGRDAKDSEVAEKMGVSKDDYFRMAKDCASTRIFSLDEAESDDDQHIGIQVEDHNGESPAKKASKAALKSALAKHITQLPEREKLVLALYYDEELNLKEIGEVLGVSESRVSQIHSQAALRLRSRMSDWLS
ncbi:MAG: RNA polymerase sigma factor for flagellar operon FliA [Flavobacteriales bacterium]|jgi:RNA polymerase sigma factor for flagellar operon FliA